MHSYVAQEGRPGRDRVAVWNLELTWTDLPDKPYPRQLIDLQ